MEFSKFQHRIFSHAKETEDNISIVAVAGSGKSTTLQYLVDQFDSNKTILVVAFNKDIVEDLRPRIKHPKANVATLNSFGNRVLRANTEGLAQIDEEKTSVALSKSFDMKNKDEQTIFYKYKGSVKRLIDLFRANLIYDLDIGKIQDIAMEYGIELPCKTKAETERYCIIVRTTYIQCLKWTAYPDFRDQVFMPIFKNMAIPRHDIVLVDEDQDLDRCQAELVLRAGSRIIMVGDPKQGIYRFRGAMSDAVTELEKRTSAVRLPLSVCYRCPISVVTLAKEIVPEIEHCDWAPYGEVRTIKNDEFNKLVQDGDMVICRCTLPLVSECLALIRQGRKATVKGRDIGEQLTTLIMKIGVDLPMDDFHHELNAYYATQSERLKNKEQQLIALSDRVETIRVLMENADSMHNVITTIDTIFSDKKSPGVTFMTIHKCKGLESTRVFILAPELLPHPRAKNPLDVETERNLKYVAITRVKFTTHNSGSLFWVSSDKSTPKVESESKYKCEKCGASVELTGKSFGDDHEYTCDCGHQGIITLEEVA